MSDISNTSGIALTAGSEISDVRENDGGVYDVDSIADMFSDGGVEEAGENVSEGGENRQNNVPEGEEAVEAQPEEQAAEVEYPTPEGWTAEEWQGMDNALRGRVDGMVKAHAQALAAAQQAQMQMRQQVEQERQQVAEKVRQDYDVMRAIIEGEYSGLDWNALAQNDPATYVQLQQGYKQRMEAIRSIKQGLEQQAQIQAQQAAQRYNAELNAEHAAVLPEVKALIGAGFNGKQYAAEIAQYLKGQGVPETAINSMSKGYEVRMATKAMLYDKLMTRRAAAAQKVAEAPMVQAPRGTAPADGNDRAAKAKALLNKNPNSTEALAALFEAM